MRAALLWKYTDFGRQQRCRCGCCSYLQSPCADGCCCPGRALEAGHHPRGSHSKVPVWLQVGHVAARTHCMWDAMMKYSTQKSRSRPCPIPTEEEVIHKHYRALLRHTASCRLELAGEVVSTHFFVACVDVQGARWRCVVSRCEFGVKISS